jgi:hypothetical protein
MSGLQQRLPFVCFEQFQPGSEGRVDITQKISALLKEGLGLSNLEELVVCTDVFDGRKGGTERMCSEMGVCLLGKIPMDPALGRAAEGGKSIMSMGRNDGDSGEDMGSTCNKPALCEVALQGIVDRVMKTAIAIHLTT